MEIWHWFHLSNMSDCFCDNSAHRHQHSLNFYDLRFIHETFISLAFSQKNSTLTCVLLWFISSNDKCTYRQKYSTRHDAKIMYAIFLKLPGGIMNCDIQHAI